MFLVLLTSPRLTCNTLCPMSCLCLSGNVKCVGFMITDIPKQLPQETYLLQLSDTKMNTIHEQSLANLDLMTRFSLTHSHLHTIHPLAFHVVPKLKSVKLSSNNLSTIPAQVFTPLTDLEQLFLDGNQLKTLAPGMLEGLTGLKVLDLNRNKLSSPTSDIFNGLGNLTFLNLGRNGIKKLPRTIFQSLTQLRKLSLYYNELETLEPGMFDTLVNLEELKIHQNHITSLPPEVFWSLKKLKNLTLSGNQLQAIPEKSFYHMPKLIQLTLYKNPLLSLPEQLMGHMPDMRDFYLYETNLTTVPENFFANMSGLEVLNFHLNEKLRELPSRLFCCFPNLTKLSLKSNVLEYLPPHVFSKLTTLNILLLNGNKLKNLPENIFQGLQALSMLDLRNNTLKTLSGDIFLSNTGLKVLNLDENPWNCTCSIRGMVSWIKLNQHVVPDREEVYCHSPCYQMLRPLHSLQDSEFNSCDASTVKIDFRSHKDFHETTQPFRTFITKPLPTTTAATGQTSNQQHAVPTTATPMKPTTSHVTSSLTSLHTQTTAGPTEELLFSIETPLDVHVSRPFYSEVVLEQGPEFVHHTLHGSWVYVWFLRSDAALTGLLMFFHILLVVTGLCLILAAMYGMYRLNNTMDDLMAEYAQI